MFCYTLFLFLLWMVIVTFVKTEGASLGTKSKLLGCHFELQNNIIITGVVCMPSFGVETSIGCMVQPISLNDDKIALPGTKIQYKCINSEPPVNADITTTCQGDKWLPPIMQCDQDIAIRKSNANWDGHDIWAPPVFTPECGKSTLKSDLATPLVWRGNVVKPREFPWHAGVYKYKGEESRKPICGASIIASRYLLSAAHCFADKSNPAKLRDFVDDFIMVGKLQPQYNVWEDYQQRHDILYVISPSYRGSDYRYQNDVAIIKIISEITFNSNVSPICLINDYFPYIQENADLWAAGWGVFDGSRVQSEDLMSIKLPFISYHKCSSNSNYKHLSTFLTPEKFCTIGENGKEMSLDEGDSGGGLVTKGPNNAYYLIGIVSLSVKGSPAVMCTYIPHFHRWIYERTLDTRNKLTSGKEPTTASWYYKYEGHSKEIVPLEPSQQLESAAPPYQRTTSDLIETLRLQQPKSIAPAMGYDGSIWEPKFNPPSMQRVNGYSMDTLPRQQPEPNAPSMQGFIANPKENAPSMQSVNGYGYSIDTLPRQQPEPKAPSMQGFSFIAQQRNLTLN